MPEAYSTANMMQKCDKLRIELTRLAEMSNNFDALYAYRFWWDSQGIDSEGDDGWPKPFCFEYENIKAFAEYWKGEDSNA